MVGRWLFALVVGASGCDRVILDDDRPCRLDDDDCDGMLDKDDPCPADAGKNSDGDGDEVGDKCDPNPTVAVDLLSEFEGFATANPFWVVSGSATWTVERGVFAQPQLADGSTERPVIKNRQPTVEVVLDPVFAGEGSTVGAFVVSKSSTGIPLECRVEHHPAGDDLVMVIGRPETGITEIARAKALPGLSGERLRIYGGQLPDFKIRCRARYGDNEGLYVDGLPFGAAGDFDTVGLRTLQASAEFRSVTIFSTIAP